MFQIHQKKKNTLNTIKSGYPYRVNTELINHLDVAPTTCAYCGRKVNNIAGHEYQLTIDHIVPRSNRGSNHSSNRIPCCRSCNSLKADNTLQYFLEQIEWRISSKIGSSRCSKNRLLHTHKNIVLIMLFLEKHKSTKKKRI